MKLATFTHAGQTRIGLVDDSAIVDLAAAVPALPQEMCAFLRAGQPALDAARNALANRSARLRLSDVWLEAPVQRPGKLITIGVKLLISACLAPLQQKNRSHGGALCQKLRISSWMSTSAKTTSCVRHKSESLGCVNDGVRD